MKRVLLFLTIFLALILPARADMYQDGSNAKPPVMFADSLMAALNGDSYSFQVKSQTSSDANAKYIWTCIASICNNPTAGMYDTSRVITIVPPSSTADQFNSYGAYFINETGRAGPPYSPSPVYAGFNVVGICENAGAGCWGGNANISDNRGQVATSHSPLFLVGWEADFGVNSPNTQVLGFLTGGTSSSPPQAANGYSCLWLDGSVHQGSVGKWTTCFSSQHGASVVFATVGTQNVNGANTPSQITNYYFRDAANALQNISMAATPGGIDFATTGAGISASIVIPNGAVFAAGDTGGTRIGNHTTSTASGTSVSLVTDAAWTQVDIGNATAPMNLHGAVGFSNTPTTGTITGSVCLDSGNRIIKKTTTGPCL